jgi:pentatricopeptide repeat protein
LLRLKLPEMYEEGYNFFMVLRTKKEKVNVVTWNHFLSCLLGLGRYDEVERAVARMKEENIELNQHTHNKLVEIYSRSGTETFYCFSDRKRTHEPGGKTYAKSKNGAKSYSV